MSSITDQLAGQQSTAFWAGDILLVLAFPLCSIPYSAYCRANAVKMAQQNKFNNISWSK
jgi:hypothetical protein